MKYEMLKYVFIFTPKDFNDNFSVNIITLVVNSQYVSFLNFIKIHDKK